MPRVAWRHPVIALIALSLVSCLHDAGECPTCPGVNSGRIDVIVLKAGLVDSIQVSLNGGAQDILRRDPRRDRQLAYEGLKAGTHEVTIVRWFTSQGLVSSRTSSLRIHLDRGETRTIRFHNDFPLVVWAPMTGSHPVIARRAHAPTPFPVG